ncbi:MAG: diguanylate cyclase [Vicinamibacterales bacterium]
MEELVELGLRKPEVPVTAVPGANGTALAAPISTLLDRVLVSLADHTPDADTEQQVTFQTRLDEYRRTFKASSEATAFAAAAEDCAKLCEHFLRGSSKYVKDRENELREMIRILREAAATIAGQTQQFSAQVLSSTERFTAMARLDDIRELKQQVASEVSVLKTAVEQRRRKEEESTTQLSRRLETLQTRLVKAEEEAALDGLTRVANRATFDRRIQQMVSTARGAKAPLCFAMVDVDHFKKINDTHGHQVGDRVLLGTAMWLTKALRPTDFVARYGGEEFGIILHGAKIGEVEKRLNEILVEIAGKSFEYEADDEVRSVRFTVSCGVTELASSDTVEDLIRRADEALYDAKRKGRNRVVSRRKSLIGGLLGR